MLSEEEVEEVRQYVVLDSVVKNNLMVDVQELKKAIEKDESIQKAIQSGVPESQINKDLIPKVVKEMYPDLDQEDVRKFSEMAVAEDDPAYSGSESGDKRFIRMAGQFVNIDDLHIDLIDRINPFQKAYEILSKSVTSKVLKVIQDTIEATRIQMTMEEALLLWPKINDFVKTFRREPGLQATDPLEVRMAQAIIFLKEQKRKAQHGQG